MKRITFKTGGFPMSTDRLTDMQDCWEDQEARLGALLGSDSYVISGCGSVVLDDDGAAVGKSGDASGWVHLDDGHVYAHVKGLRGGSQLSVVEEPASSVCYEDGESHAYTVRRYCTTTAPCGIGTTIGSNGGVVVYSVDWADVRLDMEGYVYPKMVSALRAKADMAAVSSQIAALQSEDALLRGAIDALSGGTEGSFSALQRHLVPKGTIVMWGRATPDYATTLAEIKGGYSAGYPSQRSGSDFGVSRTAASGLPWGWLPCHNVYCQSIFTPAEREAVIGAWTAYLREMGLTGVPQKVDWANGEMIDITTALGLPNLSGLFPLGSGHMGDRYATVKSGRVWYGYGEVGGEGEHTLTEGEMPKHSHGVRYSPTSLKHSGYEDPIADTGGSVTKSTEAAGGGEAHNNMPPYAVVNWLIKVV